jgi:hypothetical protein
MGTYFVKKGMEVRLVSEEGEVLVRTHAWADLQLQEAAANEAFRDFWLNDEVEASIRPDAKNLFGAVLTVRSGRRKLATVPVARTMRCGRLRLRVSTEVLGLPPKSGSVSRTVRHTMTWWAGP